MKTRLLFALPVLALALAAPAHADRGGGRDGGHRDGGHRDGGHRDGGHRDGGHRDGGYRGHHRSHSSIGFYFGAPLWDPYPRRYYDPFYDPFYDPYWNRPLVIEQQSPPVYVQRPPDVVPAPAPAPDYWYYCPGFGYYPYVPSCNRPWMQVLPQPAQ